jgi:hypothetical protein
MEHVLAESHLGIGRTLTIPMRQAIHEGIDIHIAPGRTLPSQWAMATAATSPTVPTASHTPGAA